MRVEYASATERPCRPHEETKGEATKPRTMRRSRPCRV
jgi:hypothetical protein